jgi:ADP-ribosyl-[dinitrogen reductase] hydrolase
MIIHREKLAAAVWGFIIGDALGVPVEFHKREDLRRSPVIGMMGYGSHHQPAGTWSDDSSMLLCTLENIAENGSLTDLAYKFVRWHRDAYMTAHNEVFDIGNTTRAAIMRLIEGVPWFQSGLTDEHIACGNGSLMRILPYAFYERYIQLPSSDDRYQLIASSSAITHAHPIPHLCSFFYVELIRALANDISASQALGLARETVLACLLNFEDQSASGHYAAKMHRILHADFRTINEADIMSTGYVVYTLEAALWCWINSSSFRDVVLKAVNLGEDTDTVAALAGGLAGLSFGPDAEWQRQLASPDLITKVLEKSGSANFEV